MMNYFVDDLNMNLALKESKIKIQKEKLKITKQNSKLDIKWRAYRFALRTIKLIDSLPTGQVSKIIGGN